MTDKKYDKPRSNNNYVDNSWLHNQLVGYVDEYREAKKNKLPLPRVPEAIGKAVIDTVNGISHSHLYHGYPFREDLVGDAIIVVIKYLHNYDYITRDNPHAYITYIAERRFWRFIKKEKKALATRQKLMQSIDLSAYDTQEFDKDEDFKHVLKEIYAANTTPIKFKDDEKTKKAPKKKKEVVGATLNDIMKED